MVSETPRNTKKTSFHFNTKLRPTMRLFYMHLSITAQLITLELLKRTCTQKVKTRFSGHTWKLNSGLAAKEATYSKTAPILASKSLNNNYVNST